MPPKLSPQSAESSVSPAPYPRPQHSNHSTQSDSLPLSLKQTKYQLDPTFLKLSMPRDIKGREEADSPNRTNARGSTPEASRIMNFNPGWADLMDGYEDWMNCLRGSVGARGRGKGRKRGWGPYKRQPSNGDKGGRGYGGHTERPGMPGRFGRGVVGSRGQWREWIWRGTWRVEEGNGDGISRN